MKEKNIKSIIIYITILSLLISGILHWLYNISFSYKAILDGPCYNDGNIISVMECQKYNYTGMIELLLAAIISMFIATIISYKLICNKKRIIKEENKKAIYITLEILLICKTVFNLPQTIISQEFIKIITDMGIEKIILPIVLVIILLIILSWLLYKIVYRKK